MKKRPSDLTDLERMKTLDTLYTAVGSIRGRAMAKRILRELLTESERVMLGRRILIARKILSGATYEEIQTSLGVGVATIIKVHRWLSDEIPGYEDIVRGIQKEMNRRERRADAKRQWKALKRKYPLHFLFFH
jgi:uncharacterized protein YerC